MRLLQHFRIIEYIEKKTVKFKLSQPISENTYEIFYFMISLILFFADLQLIFFLFFLFTVCNW